MTKCVQFRWKMDCDILALTNEWTRKQGCIIHPVMFSPPSNGLGVGYSSSRKCTPSRPRPRCRVGHP